MRSRTLVRSEAEDRERLLNSSKIVTWFYHCWYGWWNRNRSDTGSRTSLQRSRCLNLQAVVTNLSPFEGKRRQKQVDEGIAQLRKCVDTLITVPNQRLIAFADESTSMKDALRVPIGFYIKRFAVYRISSITGVHQRRLRRHSNHMENKDALMGTGVGFGDEDF